MYAAYIHRTPAMIKANAQETHGDICQISLLPADSSCCYLGGSRERQSSNSNACATSTWIAESRRLQTDSNVDAQWRNRCGAQDAQDADQVCTFHRRTIILLSSLLCRPLPAATHPCIPSGMLFPRHQAARSRCGGEAGTHRFQSLSLYHV
jgi:hypothetical protein